jgi:hypothetical protein
MVRTLMTLLAGEEVRAETMMLPVTLVVRHSA